MLALVMSLKFEFLNSQIFCVRVTIESLSSALQQHSDLHAAAVDLVASFPTSLLGL